MAAAVTIDEQGGVIVLTRIERVLTWRREVRFDAAQVRVAAVVRRGDAESAVEHRRCGIGTHDGSRRPGGRRIGLMLGRDAIGDQFWCVPRGGEDDVLLAIDLEHHDLARIVVAIDRPEAVAERLRSRAASARSAGGGT